MIRYIVDRLEEGLAVCETEDKKKAVFPLKDLPEAIREGDVLQELDGVFSRDEEETSRRREKMKERLENTEEEEKENGRKSAESTLREKTGGDRGWE